jgi:hypothetical protein
VDLAIVVPMLGRAHRVEPLLESIHSTCDARVLFALSPGDRAVQRAVARAGAESIVVPRRPIGDYARKINVGYRATTEPLIFLGADDLLFHTGWFGAATAQLRPGIGVVGTNDLGSPRVMRGDHSTHSLVTRDYADRYGTIDRPGEILHEGYVHEWVDDELVGTAKARRAWAFAHDARVEHLHPNWHPEVPIDRLYAAQRFRLRAGRPLYQRRQRLWTSPSP